MRIGILCSRIRVEEKLIFEALQRRGLSYELLDDRELVLDMDKPSLDYDVILERCINHSRALYALRILEDWGQRCVNSYEVADTCGNKLLTTSALLRAGLPCPRTMVAFTRESAWCRLCMIRSDPSVLPSLTSTSSYGSPKPSMTSITRRTNSSSSSSSLKTGATIEIMPTPSVSEQHTTGICRTGS